MNCQQVQCKNRAKVICNVHKTKFCGDHYIDHSVTCENKAIPINTAKEIKRIQIHKLDLKISQIKTKILKLADSLLFSIKKSVKSSLRCLYQQRTIVMESIQKGNQEIHINELIEVIPDDLTENKKSFQSLVDLQKVFRINDFKLKANALAKKYEIKPPTERAPLKPTSNPVIKGLDKFNLIEKITWCKNQSWIILNENWLDEIKLTKNMSHMFICKQNTVCKIKEGKNYLGKSNIGNIYRDCKLHRR